MSRTLLLMYALGLVACTPPGRASEAMTPFGGAFEAITPSYPLDDVSRVVAAEGELPCRDKASLGLVSYRGVLLQYDRPVHVHPAFAGQLKAFEEIVVEVAQAHFGRAPKRVVHFGAFACRPVRGRPELVSEHALGNALDVAGFDFGPLPRRRPQATEPPPELPRPLQRAFQVRLLKHWNATGKDAPQSAFLHALADRIVARPDVFRVVLGPGWPGHDNHFHLDHAPYRLVGLQ